MRKKIVVGALLCVMILVIILTPMPTRAESTVYAMLEMYNSIDSYKATVTMEIKAATTFTYDLIYKKPYRLKTIEEDGTEYITSYGWLLKYKPGQDFACKSIAKTPLLLVQLGGDYFKTIEEMGKKMYDFEYLGIEEINGEESEVIKLVPKIEMNPFTEEETKIAPGKIWISTNNNMPIKIEIYEDNNYSEWKVRTTYSNTKLNIDIPDTEFELPAGTEVLPKTATFLDLQEAKNEFGDEIITPNYTPPKTELDYIEINKQCGGSSALLNYKKDGKIVLTVWERVSNMVREAGNNNFVDGETWLGEPCEAISCEAIVQGLRAEIVRNVASNYVNANEPITNIRWKCTGIDFSVDTTFNDAESIKILESINCK